MLVYADDDHAIFGECKWTNEKVDSAVLDMLIVRSELFRYRYKYLCIFAKTGFTSGCADKVKAMRNVRLITFEDMNQID